MYKKSNFNSHAHVERDEPPSEITPIVGISTHTLTWSVTCSLGGFLQRVKISTHTLTWSVTALLGGGTKTITISTHTLTWSVTA